MMHLYISPAREAAQSLIELVLFASAEHDNLLDQYLEGSRARFQQVVDEVADVVLDPGVDDELALECSEDLCVLLHRLLRVELILSAQPKLRDELIALMGDFERQMDLRDESLALANQAIEKAMGKEGGAR
jgi:hypothetical protein